MNTTAIVIRLYDVIERVFVMNIITITESKNEILGRIMSLINNCFAGKWHTEYAKYILENNLIDEEIIIMM